MVGVRACERVKCRNGVHKKRGVVLASRAPRPDQMIQPGPLGTRPHPQAPTATARYAQGPPIGRPNQAASAQWSIYAARARSKECHAGPAEGGRPGFEVCTLCGGRGVNQSRDPEAFGPNAPRAIAAIDQPRMRDEAAAARAAVDAEQRRAGRNETASRASRKCGARGELRRHDDGSVAALQPVREATTTTPPPREAWKKSVSRSKARPKYTGRTQTRHDGRDIC